MLDPFNAFCPHGHFTIPGSSQGPLAALTFAAKDLFDVAHHPTGAGNPDWLKSHAVPGQSAPAVQRLLDAGATLAGKTITDELAYSLSGRNAHYGTPINPWAPERLPGGSSSGSASATAGGLVDFALGSDTGGSVRVPAALCGLYGFRPTYGRIAVQGVVPLAPSFDTVGWFAREAQLLQRVGQVLLGEDADPPLAGCLLVADDAFALADASVRSALEPTVSALAALRSPVRHATLSPEGFPTWSQAFQTIQRREVWAVHGAWIEKVHPAFGPDVGERFTRARAVTPEQGAAAEEVRRRVRARLAGLLGEGDFLCLPTAPAIAPLRNAGAQDLEDFRGRTMCLTCTASLAGLPQVTLPLGDVEGCPVGLSLIAAPGRDGALLSLIVALGRG